VPLLVGRGGTPTSKGTKFDISAAQKVKKVSLTLLSCGSRPRFFPAQ
jgi:hypothetical protein